MVKSKCYAAVDLGAESGRVTPVDPVPHADTAAWVNDYVQQIWRFVFCEVELVRPQVQSTREGFKYL